MGETATKGTEQDDDLPDPELFPNGSLEGDGLTFGKFTKPGKDNALEVKIKAVKLPSRAGLADVEKLRTLLVTCRPHAVKQVPHMLDGKVDRYTTTQDYTPVFVEGVQRGDAGRLEAAFRELLRDDHQAAARALDAMQVEASNHLS